MTQQNRQQLWKLPACCEWSFSFYIEGIFFCLGVTKIGMTHLKGFFFGWGGIKSQDHAKVKTLHPQACLLIQSPWFAVPSTWWSLLYLCKQAVAVCEILLLQQLSFPGLDGGCLSFRGQLPSNLPVSLNKKWQSVLRQISWKYSGFYPFKKKRRTK